MKEYKITLDLTVDHKYHDLKEMSPDQVAYAIKTWLVFNDNDIPIRVTAIKVKETEKLLKRTCFDCDQDICKETIEKYPDTELCGECLVND